MSQPELELSEHERAYVLSRRGGCRCQDPGAMPPCSACTDPLDDDEVEAIEELRTAMTRSYFEEYQHLTTVLFGVCGQMKRQVWENCSVAAQEDMLQQLRNAVKDMREGERSKPEGWGTW